ncbi:MAG: UvrD-helicase domain-containing protein [Verrucomicrobiota bacterium]
MSFHYTLKPSSTHSSPQIDYQAELNEEQYRAATAKPGPLLVIAGAGSGKTRTLTYRVGYLVEHGVNPENILLLTFTNKAAKEMMRRVEDLLPHDFSQMWGGTFHHVGHRLLRRFGQHLGLEKNFTILDQEDSKDLVAACLSDAGVDTREKRFPKAEVLQTIFSLSANCQNSVEEILTQQYEYFLDFQTEIETLAKQYVERKRKSQSVDYDDLLSLTLRLLQEQKDVLDFCQSRFRHILVDEYQDTNRVQADLVDLLADAHHQVMVVGDDAQSIYSWRGANFENILNFPDRHEGCEVIRIETNYRSSPEILELANTSIQNNQKQFAKELRATKSTSVKPALITLDDTRRQAQFIAQRVLELRDEGIELTEMAVLYRSHFHSMELQMELTRRNIPFQITSGLRFFEQAHIKDAAAFLKLAVNPNDEVSFKRICLMLPGIGARTAHRLWNEISTGADWASAKVPAKAKSVWEQWAALQPQLRDEVADSRPDQLLQMVAESFYEDYLKAKYANFENRFDDLKQLQAYADEFEETAEFLAQLSLMTNLDAGAVAGAEEDDEMLKLSSIHQAKGLEWKVVFVIMLCDGMFPSSRSIESEEGEEEERRLFYVSVTRAQDELYLTYPQLHAGRGAYGETWQQASRFISELPVELCNVWKIRTEPDWSDI